VIGLITLGMKQTGKRSAGKPHAAFDVAGVGNVTMVAGLRSIAKEMELPPAPTVRAPAPDPTRERLEVRLLRPTRLDEQARRKNTTKSKVRAKVEHVFRILKRCFGFDKVRYRGIAKNHNRLCANFALINLYLHRKRLAPLGA
jgi:hypothetical protein